MKKHTNFVFLLLIITVSLSAQKKTFEYGSNPDTGKYTNINGTKLYYEIYGQGQPLLMLHGNGGSMAAFKNQIPYFEKKFKVIAVDSRLQGKSGRNPDTLSYDMMANDFAALLDELKIDSAYVLGWSDGGIDGLIMAMMCPRKVKMLAVSGANVVPDSTALPYSDILWMRNFVEHDTSASKTEIALNKMMLEQPNIPFSDLARIHCPVLVMAGDHDMIKPEHTLKIFQSIPGASLCIFPDSNHGVCQQHPDLFNRTVLDFFSRK